jgi:AcrR family transcriptional regulator
MNDNQNRTQAILDAALDLGERRGWDAVHLHDISAAMAIPLTDIQRYYPQKDALAEAWLDHAEAALVAMAETPGWMDLSPRERLFRAIISWLDALAVHKEPTAAMLRYKVQPDHVHLQVQGLIRVSRTVQRIRETARLPEAGWRGELQEVALTGIFLSTLGRWLVDDSPDHRRTHALLDHLLSVAERATTWIAPGT